MGILTYLKLGAFALVVLALGAFALHYRSLAAEAARVPALEATIAEQNDRAAKLAKAIAAADAARAEASAALTRWQDLKTATIEAVKKEGRRAAAATNPACAPAADDRRLRNDALNSLLRSSGGREPVAVPSP